MGSLVTQTLVFPALEWACATGKYTLEENRGVCAGWSAVDAPLAATTRNSFLGGAAFLLTTLYTLLLTLLTPLLYIAGASLYVAHTLAAWYCIGLTNDQRCCCLPQGSCRILGEIYDDLFSAALEIPRLFFFSLCMIFCGPGTGSRL